MIDPPTPAPPVLFMREQQEEFEAAYLSPSAAQAAKTRGRARPEEPC